MDGPAVRRGTTQFEIVTPILFGAVLAAREATGRRGTGQQDALMPRDGQPLYRVAVALGKAVTGKVIDSERAETRLRKFVGRNPSAGWIGWPNPDE